MEETSTVKPLSKRKKRLFKIVAVFTGLLLLIIFEMVLRLVGYGASFPLFVEDAKNHEAYILNPEVGQKYFFNAETATSGIPKPFPKTKEEGTTRIFILGASTAIGYPYKHNAGFHHWLEYGLNRSYPDQKFEIINTALTGVNSYTLLDFGKQLVDYEPDAVLIYAGHNEYYGALGVGSTSSYGHQAWVVHLMLELRKLRTTQLIASVMASFKNDVKPGEVSKETLMQQMVEEQKIPLDSEIYKAGILQFKTNLNQLLDALEAHKVPTFLSIIVSNEKDVKPFISDASSKETSAEHYFRKAQADYDSQDYAAAKSNFIKAKELDMLRFRAPEQMNFIIAEASKTHQQVTLVDAKADFESATEHKIIGNDLLLEHVHPNVKGYSVLGYAFFKSLVASEVLPKVTTLSYAELTSEMPVTALDSLEGDYEVMMLKEGWPYFEPFPKLDVNKMSPEQQIAGRLAAKKITWVQASEQLFQYYMQKGDSLKALKVVEGVALQHPTDLTYLRIAADLATKTRQKQKAIYLYKRCFELDKDPEFTKIIARGLIEAEAYEASLFYLEYIKKTETENGFAHRIANVISTIVRLNKNRETLNATPELQVELAENYRLIGRRKKALLYLESVLTQDPNNAKAKQMFIELSN